ncbi:unnamed protein product [Didymodactylos carnosus]|uniref:Uncharacterized protein n=1 Tax=Didymodactylos carnosus TaxID=1234261 RepID=A0A8S2QZH2_9BILA|nr:unnamed protein product [Didymodactylos carnosus]CAF4129390.1 unnamed protein product [Didymodactylos carnosus]
MPRVTFSADYTHRPSSIDSLPISDYHLHQPYRQSNNNSGSSTKDENQMILSPNIIDEILTRKLYKQMQTTPPLSEQKLPTIYSGAGDNQYNDVPVQNYPYFDKNKSKPHAPRNSVQKISAAAANVELPRVVNSMKYPSPFLMVPSIKQIRLNVKNGHEQQQIPYLTPLFSNFPVKSSMYLHQATPSETAKLKTNVDHELCDLIDRFLNLSYLNTIPIINLLATAYATNFLQQNIKELDGELLGVRQQQTIKSYKIPDVTTASFQNNYMVRTMCYLEKDEDNISCFSV